MKVNKKYISIGLALAFSFALGRYMTPEKIKTEEKIVYVEKKDTETQKEIDKKKHRVITKTETLLPDGTKTTTTTTDEKSDTNKTVWTKELVEKTLTEEREKLVEMGRNRVTISVISGYQFSDLSKPGVIGGHITKPILGPIAIGVWGLSNSMGGVSLGLQF